MKKIMIIVFLISSLSLYSEDSKIKAAGNLMWFTKYSEALADAKSKDNYIIMNFTGSDWCSWCIKLSEDVFSKEEFHKWSGENATLLHLDFPQSLEISEDQTNQNQFLAQMYGVEGFPTIIILNSEGQLIGRTGYGDNVNNWINNIETLNSLFYSLVIEY